MAASRPPIAVPPIARARALGALIEPGDHAIAYASEEGDGLLAGFALEGFEAGDRVLILAGSGSPRAISARLRAQGVAPPRDRPGALLIETPAPCVNARDALAVAEENAKDEGFKGLRVAHLRAPGGLGELRRQEATMPRKFRGDVTVLCIYGQENLGRISHSEAWTMSAPHGRILCV